MINILKKSSALLLALVLCLSMAACGENEESFEESDFVEEPEIDSGDIGIEEPWVDDGEISIEDLEGFWYPENGINSVISALSCFYIDGMAGTWQEYDQYGDPVDNIGPAYTNGEFLTLADVPVFGEVEDVEIPVADAYTLVDEDGEIYRIKGWPDFQGKPDPSNAAGVWYYVGNQNPENATILTLDENGSFSRSGDSATDGTYTYSEYESTLYDGSEGDTGTTVFRQEVSLSGSYMDETFYPVSDGQVLVNWDEDKNGCHYYIREDALGDEELLTRYWLASTSFWG